MSEPRTSTTALDVAWEALWLALGNEDAGPAGIIARHRPLIEAAVWDLAEEACAEARASLDVAGLEEHANLCAEIERLQAALTTLGDVESDEARASLDVERLARAFQRVGFALHEETWYVTEYDLPDIAREYAALEEPTP